MATRKKSEIETSLQKKGFHQIQGDHHFFHYYNLDGQKTTIRTKTSHTPKMRDISDALLSQMAKQCKLSKKDFLDLIDCPLDQAGFEQKVF